MRRDAANGITVAIYRALTTVPAHALLSVIMGYYVGRAKFAPDAAAQRQLLWRALLLPIFAHGLYDSLLLSTEQIVTPARWVFAISTWALVAMLWVVGVHMIRYAQPQSPFKRPNPLLQPVAALTGTDMSCPQCGAPLK